MAKPEVPYERVAEAALGLYAHGERVTNRAVRAISGGSPATVSKHLKRFEQEHPEASARQRAAAPDLPAGVLRVLQDELRRRDAEVSAVLEEQLATAQETLDDLTRENGELQEQAGLIERDRDDLAAERERLQGQVQQQAADLQRLQEQLEQERAAAETARVALAQERLRAEGAKELADSLKSERESQRQTLETERAGRIDAERALASTSASL